MRHLARALQQSGRALESLTMVQVGYSILYAMGGILSYNDQERGYAYDEYNIVDLVRPLKRLRIFIQTTHRESAMNVARDVPEASIFLEAPELRVLSIHQPDRLPDHEPSREEQPDPVCVVEIIKQGMQLNNIPTRTNLPHLYELSLANTRLCGEDSNRPPRPPQTHPAPYSRSRTSP